MSRSLRCAEKQEAESEDLRSDSDIVYMAIDYGLKIRLVKERTCLSVVSQKREPDSIHLEIIPLDLTMTSFGRVVGLGC